MSQQFSQQSRIEDLVVEQLHEAVDLGTGSATHGQFQHGRQIAQRFGQQARHLLPDRPPSP